jgi:hypothetical protein
MSHEDLLSPATRSASSEGSVAELAGSNCVLNSSRALRIFVWPDQVLVTTPRRVLRYRYFSISPARAAATNSFSIALTRGRFSGGSSQPS